MSTAHARRFERIAEDIWTLRVPSFGPGVEFTNCYLISRNGLDLVVDPGWDLPETGKMINDALARLGKSVEDIGGILATHSHPDHAGGARSLRTASGAWFAMGWNEPVPDHEELGTSTDADIALFQVWGVPRLAVEDVTEFERRQPSLPVASPDLRIGSERDIGGVAGFDSLLTPGHSDGHVCFVDRSNGIIMTGDHILPKINSHVAVAVGRGYDPLSAYLNSLEVVAEFDDFLVAPGHETRFRPLRNRRLALADRVERRSKEVRSAMDKLGAKNVWELARDLRWSRGFNSLHGSHLRLALAQTASHLELLRSRGHTVEIATRATLPARA